MITYSTNCMGPASMEWYRERGLTEIVQHVVETDFISKITKLPLGSVYEVEELTERWSGGRIDIYGLDQTEHYGGMSEYSLPVMTDEDWGRFSNWLDNFQTETLWEFEKIIQEYEKTNPKITWDSNNGDKQ